MTYNFEEPEFPDAPSLARFGLTVKNYLDLAEVDAEIEAAASDIPVPKIFNWGQVILSIPTIVWVISVSQVKPKDLGNYFWPFCFACGVILVVIVAIGMIVETRYQKRRKRRLAKQNEAREEKIRARAPELMQRRDDLLAPIKEFEDAHAQYFRDKARDLVNANASFSEFVDRKRALTDAYSRARETYRSEQLPSADYINSIVLKYATRRR